MKRNYFVIMLCCMLLLTGCGKEQKVTTNEVKLGSQEIWGYYVNINETEIVAKPCKLNDRDEIRVQVDHMIDLLSDVEKNDEYQSPIPEGITYVEKNIEQKQDKIQVEFEIVYDQVNAEALLFFKTCVAKTLLQLKDVDTVAISLTDIANNDPETATVTESFDEESFNLSFGDANGYSQKGTITLYFADETGELLKEYHKVVEISNNSSLARIVVESLISGPQQEGYMATVSGKTSIQNISVKDNICYIDLSEEFYDTDNPLKNDIIVYSIVNSLCELPTVSKVQFLKNGEKQPFYRETMPFDGIFERNLDLIKQEET